MFNFLLYIVKNLTLIFFIIHATFPTPFVVFCLYAFCWCCAGDTVRSVGTKKPKRSTSDSELAVSLLQKSEHESEKEGSIKKTEITMFI